MNDSGIYIIKNVVNGKAYVGQSIHIRLRWREEKSSLRGGYFRNEHLQASWNRYGESSFEWRVLENVAPDLLDVREQAWIAHYKSNQKMCGYNQTAGGEQRKIITEALRKRLSDSHKGLRNTPEQNIKIGLASKARGCKHLIGTKRPQAIKDKISRSMKLLRQQQKDAGHPVRPSEEACLKGLATQALHGPSAATRAKRSASLRLAWQRRKGETSQMEVRTA